MSKSIYLKEDFINQQGLTEGLSNDPTHGIYVVNTSYEEVDVNEFDSIDVKHPLERFSDAGIKGVVFIEVPSEKGQHPATISVPAVDIPFDLVEFGSSAKAIMDSVSFKGALKKGALSLLSKTAYERISTNSVVVNKRNILRDTMGTRVFGVAEDKTDVANKLNKDLGSAVTKGVRSGTRELSPVVIELCNTDQAISHSDQYKKFLIVEDKLSKQDFMHLVEHCPVQKIKEQAEQNLITE